MTEFASRGDQLSLHIAETIGGAVEPERVVKVVSQLNDGRYMVHGVKFQDSIPGVFWDGVLPLTPEGGMVSFWTTGERVFGFLTEMKQRLQVIDSSFFHYAHAMKLDLETRDISLDSQPTMLMAVTNIDLLTDLGIKVKWVENAVVRVSGSVPAEGLTILSAVAETPGTWMGKRREAGQSLEQQMFELLERTLDEGIVGGRHKAVQVSL